MTPQLQFLGLGLALAVCFVVLCFKFRDSEKGRLILKYAFAKLLLQLCFVCVYVLSMPKDLGEHV